MALEVGKTYIYRDVQRSTPGSTIFRVLSKSFYGYKIIITRNSFPYFNKGEIGEILVSKGSLVDDYSVLSRKNHPLTKIFENP